MLKRFRNAAQLDVPPESGCGARVAISAIVKTNESCRRSWKADANFQLRKFQVSNYQRKPIVPPLVLFVIPSEGGEHFIQM
ncbi:Hypothetical protein SMAX5B_002042 [Scophthalmus maximus]|uniref:Uncharacterized protein n=1 Tax=Scophthalmus maximus TaxID=52904 RepID=A0A2U9CX51_SCOMX|nr:Hypothetical protein SMAX5B_002042 [Scophthalmus maximus]